MGEFTDCFPAEKFFCRLLKFARAFSISVSALRNSRCETIRSFASSALRSYSALARLYSFLASEKRTERLLSAMPLPSMVNNVSPAPTALPSTTSSPGKSTTPPVFATTIRSSPGDGWICPIVRMTCPKGSFRISSVAKSTFQLCSLVKTAPLLLVITASSAACIASFRSANTVIPSTVSCDILPDIFTLNSSFASPFSPGFRINLKTPGRVGESRVWLTVSLSTTRFAVTLPLSSGLKFSKRVK